MTQDPPAADEVLSIKELDEVLAEATGTTTEEIRKGAEEMYIAPPEEATVLDE